MRTIILSSAMTLWLGCATSTGTPPALHDARTAYVRAQSAGADELAPVQLHVARNALDRAERAFNDDDPMVADLAYVAERRARIAAAHAKVARNEQRVALARQAIEQAEARRQQVTSRELGQTRQELSRRSQQLAVGQQRLVAEQVARQRAEGRAFQAEQTAQAAIESLNQIANVREESRGTVITLSGSVLFASGQSTLLPIATQRLDEVARVLADYPDRAILVEGHTDSRGSASQNEALSFMRANAVREYLIARGVAAANVRAMGIGPSRPVADNHSAEGRANNRRVEIIIEQEQQTNR